MEKKEDVGHYAVILVTISLVVSPRKALFTSYW